MLKVYNNSQLLMLLDQQLYIHLILVHKCYKQNLRMLDNICNFLYKFNKLNKYNQHNYLKQYLLQLSIYNKIYLIHKHQNHYQLMNNLSLKHMFQLYLMQLSKHKHHLFHLNYMLFQLNMLNMLLLQYMQFHYKHIHPLLVQKYMLILIIHLLYYYIL